MMLPLNLNLQLNATSALWTNDSTLEILHKHILKYDQLKYKKGKEKQDPDVLSSRGGASA